MMGKTNVTRNPFLPMASTFVMAGALFINPAGAQTPSYSSGTPWGTVGVKALVEASGLAASWRNPKVLWTHNDGSKKKFYAVSPGGLHLATYSIKEKVDDVESIAVGPGPVEGVSYLYIGDTGGAGAKDNIRSTVQILRVPEPVVSLDVPGSVPAVDFSAAEVFTLAYPAGESYDAESMFIDPLGGDIYVFTKTTVQSRVYRAALASGVSGTSLNLTFVGTVPVPEPSDAAISRDGRQIILRHENAAFTWTRAEEATIAATLAQAARSIPVIGEPLEPNGEAVTFLTDGSGYVTLSEEDPVVYQFQTRTEMAPVTQSRIAPRAVFTGSTVRIPAPISGYPQPSWVWRRNGEIVPGQTAASLTFTGVTPEQAGTYEVTATNFLGTATASVTLAVMPRPDVRVTEVMALPGATTGADWWELTSFESIPVDLSGWRFNDDGGDLDNAFVFPAGLTIAPGESIVFVEDLTPAAFRAWWGSGVQTGTQIVTYTGGGLALNTPGDAIRLWNDTTTDVDATITSRVFGASTAGISLNYDPVTGVFGGASVVGVNGVFTSTGFTDTGSPGTWLPPATHPTLSAISAGDNLRLEFPASMHRWYTLESTDDLGAEIWATESSFQATSNSARFFEVPITEDRQFFRVRMQ